MKRSRWKLLLSVGLVSATSLIPVVVPISSHSAFASGPSAPPWEYDTDANSPYGNIVFYDAQGNQVTSGTNDLPNPFAYAIAGTSKDPNADIANLNFFNPTPGGTGPGGWTGFSEGSSQFSPTSDIGSTTPLDITTLAGSGYPTVNASAANITTWISEVGSGVSTQTGYANTIEVRIQDAGPKGAGNSGTSTYWESDIGYNTTSSPITVDGTTVPADGWAQLFPFVTSTSTTVGSTDTSPQPVNTQIPLTAVVTPASTGLVQFYDNGLAIGSPMATSGGTATISYTPAQGSHEFTASFVAGPPPGDESKSYTSSASFTGGSVSSEFPFTIQAAATATSTSLSSSETSGVDVGASVMYTATVTPTPDGGKVDFSGSGTSACQNVTLTNGQATCITSYATTAGSPLTIGAQYLGDTSFAGSTATNISQAVNPAGSSTKLTAATSPASQGVPDQLTAAITSATTGTPGGTVTFTDTTSSTTLCSAVPTSAGTAACAATFPSTGTQSVTATFADTDGNYTDSSDTLSLLVNPATATTVSASPTSVVVGQPTTYTATVTPTPTPNGGTVSFSAITSCQAVPVVSGTAACTTSYSSTAGSPHSVTASYTGDATFGGSLGTTTTPVTVTKASTATTVTPTSPPAIVSGQSVTYTATVTVTAPGAGSPTGTVAFTDNGSNIAGCSAQPLGGSGQASCTTTSLLATGSDQSIAATYNGDSNFVTSTTSVTQTVNPDASTTVVSSSSSSVLINHPVTYTAKITGNSPGSGHPLAGTVAFSDGATQIAACLSQIVSAAGLATCTQTYPTGGTHTITATFNGNAAYNGSTSAPFTQTVTTASPPGAPTNLLATTTGAGDGAVDLTWTAPASSGTSPITGYDVFVGTTPGGESATPVDPVSATSTSDAVTGLTDGKTYYFTVKAINAVGSSPASSEISATPRAGLFLVGLDGGLNSFGSAGFHGSLDGIKLAAPIVGMASTADPGYWLVASDGGVFAFGDAGFYGSLGGIKLAKPIVGIAATPDGKGYWTVASDGGVFAFGDAGFYGSLGGLKLAKPIVGIAASPDGHGYYLVASDGGVFAFGDASFRGSLGGLKLAKPIVGIGATPDGLGYWLVASDGGVFAFGDAAFHGSLGGLKLAKPAVAIVPTADGGGYWIIASDGGVFNFGDATFVGSATGAGDIIGGA